MPFIRNTRTTNCLLSNFYIKAILNSKLLLDEDLECLLTHYFHDYECSTEVQISTFRRFLSGLSLAGSYLIYRYKCPLYLMSLTAPPLVFVGIQYYRSRMYVNQRKKNITVMLQTMSDMAHLNQMIMHYFKSRIPFGHMPSLLNSYSRAMKELIAVTFNEEVPMLHLMKMFAKTFGNYVPPLQNHFDYLDNLDLDQFISNHVVSIHDGTLYLKKLCDMYMLICSNFLNALGVVLCSNIWTEYSISVEEMLNYDVPRVKKELGACYKKISKKFDDVKYYHINRKPMELLSKPSKAIIASRLVDASDNMLTFTSSILEKSQIMYKLLEGFDFDSLPDKVRVCNAIAELRTEVFNFYEGLDVLHKLYELNINRGTVATRPKVVNEPALDSVEVALEDATFNPTEPDFDEEFQAYVGANDEAVDSRGFEFADEQESRRFAAVLSQDLQAQLRKHTRFVNAMKRRGSLTIANSEEDDNPPQVMQVPDEQSMPLPREPGYKFSDFLLPTPLPLTIPIPHPLPNCNPFNQQRIPPPPPPPLPPIDLRPYSPSSADVGDFLNSIQRLGEMRNVAEETFGNDGDE